MAFLPYEYQAGEIAQWTYLPCAAGSFTVGQAAVIVSDKAKPVSSGTGEDTGAGLHYIAMFDGAVSDGDIMPFVLASTSGLIFETELSAALTGAVPGNKYTIDSTGTKMTATQTDGCCEFIALSEAGKNQPGDKVLVKVI